MVTLDVSLAEGPVEPAEVEATDLAGERFGGFFLPPGEALISFPHPVATVEQPPLWRFLLAVFRGQWFDLFGCRLGANRSREPGYLGWIVAEFVEHLTIKTT